MLRGIMSGFRKSVSVATSIALLAVLVPALAFGGTGAASDPPDPLAAEIERWLAVGQSKPGSDPLLTELKQPNLQPLERAQEALRSGRRLLALQRFGTPRTNLSAAVYLAERSADQRKDMAAFDAEWKRVGDVLRSDLGTPAPGRFEGMPAFARALSEAAILQVRTYYQASLDYGHSTMPDPGLLYLGTAQAQRDLVAFYRTLPAPSPRRPAPPLRSLRPEIDALQAEMLSVYRPPLSIDQHDEFISASATLKEARELDAAGLRYGALLRYLLAAQQFLPLRPAPAPPLDAGALDSRLRELAARLSAGDVDHGIGQMFLESAQSGIAKSTPGSPSPVAMSVATDVLPRYFAALEPARPQPPRPEPQVTVTLVRWPYT
jgi:hypothetical protein